MTWRIIIDPKELMDTAVLLGTSAVELADIGSTLRSCTGCAMPPEVRNSVDAIVATTDRVLDDMATQLRTEAADLAQRAIIAANDMLTAAGYPPLPGTTSNLPTTADGIPINPAPTRLTAGVPVNPPAPSRNLPVTAAGIPINPPAPVTRSRTDRMVIDQMLARMPGMPSLIDVYAAPGRFQPYLNPSMREIKKYWNTPSPSESQIGFLNPVLADRPDLR